MGCDYPHIPLTGICKNLGDFLPMSVNEHTLIEASTENLKAFADLIRYNVGKCQSTFAEQFLEHIKFEFDGNPEECIFVTCYKKHSKIVNAVFRGNIFATENAKPCKFYVNAREFLNTIESATLVIGEGVICIDIDYADLPCPIMVVRSTDDRFKKQIKCKKELPVAPDFMPIDEAALPGFNDDAFGAILKTNELEQAMMILDDALPKLEDNVLGLVGFDFTKNGKIELASTDGSRLHAATINCIEIPEQQWTSLDKLADKRVTVSPVAIKNAIYMSKRLNGDYIVMKFKEADVEIKKQCNKGLVTFAVGSAFKYEIYSTWIDGDYLRWQKLITEDEKLTTGYLADLQKLQNALIAIQKHTNERTNYAAIHFKDGRMNIMAKDYNGNSICISLRKSECIGYKNSPKQQQSPFFCINVFYFLGVVRSMLKLSNQRAYILFTGNPSDSKEQVMSQLIFMPERISNIEYKALIMPVQIKLKEDLDPDNYCEWIPLGAVKG